LIYTEIIFQNKKIGTLLVEWPLRNVDIAFAENKVIGNSGDMLICQPMLNEQAKCFSARHHSVYFIPKQKSNQDLPIHNALKGSLGLMYVYDYEYKRVVAAYAPVDSLGLGLVVHMALAELYQPITKSLRTIFPTVMVMILIGLLLMRMQVIPLVRRVINAEKDLIRNNKNLQESEERYALAIKGSNTGVLDWDIEKNYVYYSPYLKSMLGYSDAEFPNHLDSFNKILHPDDHDRVWQLVEDHLKNHTHYEAEYRLRRKTGGYQWFRGLGQAIWDDEGNPVRMAGSIINITERKKADQRLTAQFAITQMFADAQDIAEIADKITHHLAEKLEWEFGSLWIVDEMANVIYCIGTWAQPSLREGKALRKVIINSQFNLGVGIPGRVWQTGQPLWIFDTSKDMKIQHASLLKENDLNSAFCFPMTLHNKIFGILEFFGRERQAPDEAMLKMMSAVGTQIGLFVQRRAAEKSLRESEGYKTAILESVSDSIMTMEDDGHILTFNTRTLAIFDYTASELKMKNISTLIPNIATKIKNFENKLAGDLVGIRKNGDTIAVEITISKMVLDEKNMLVCVIRDVSERNKIEKLKNELVSVVSHELRAPLASIRESLRLILNDAIGPVSAQAKKLLAIVHRSSERLIKIINDMLDIEKIQAGKVQFLLEQVNIGDMIKEAIASVKRDSEQQKTSLRLLEPYPDIKVNVDQLRLIQVLHNLIANAEQFSEEGDEITIKILDNDATVRVEIKDKRETKPEMFHENIFERRPSVNSSDASADEATGLSLSVCKAIIEKFRGKIAFYQSDKGETIYYFDLPVTHEFIAIDSVKSIASVKKLGTLLVCEDDEEQANYLEKLLNSEGFQVDIAFTAREAKKLLSAKKYDALLLDLVMPDQNGITMIRELRSNEETRKLPVIIVSVSAKKGESLLQGNVVSVIDWFDKPVDFKKLIQAIEVLRSQLHKEILSVLHIEDDPATRHIVTNILRNNATISEADTLSKARKILVKQHFDLVILDLLMPDGSGTELLPALGKLGLPVIVFSAVELDQEYVKDVKKVLIRSETSSEYFINTIKNIVESGE